MAGFLVIVVAFHAISIGRRVSNWQTNSCDQRLLWRMRIIVEPKNWTVG